MATDVATKVLVTTDWLAEHLADPGLVVAEVDENPDLYEEGHIRGAVKLHWRDDLQDANERDIVDRAPFERVLGARAQGLLGDSARRDHPRLSRPGPRRPRQHGARARGRPLSGRVRRRADRA